MTENGPRSTHNACNGYTDNNGSFLTNPLLATFRKEHIVIVNETIVTGPMFAIVTYFVLPLIPAEYGSLDGIF